MGSSAKPSKHIPIKKIDYVPYYVPIRSAIRSSKFHHDSH